MTQTEWVLGKLLEGVRITPMDALRGCGCLRLAARVEELRREGMPIQTRTVQRFSKRFAEGFPGGGIVAVTLDSILKIFAGVGQVAFFQILIAK